MCAVQAAHREERNQSGVARLQLFIRTRWMPVTGLAGIIVLAVWLPLYNKVQSTSQNRQALSEISAAFSASQEVVDALPSVTVGPLADEVDKMNQDVDRTADFLLATLP
jgi:hypothetical protein